MLRAARLLGRGRGAALTLDKRLPVASGIGGGSADAAAALRLLARLWGLPLPPAEALLGLGADVPVCLAGTACRMRGIGEELEPVALPPFWLVLANPGVPVATGAVFAGLAGRFGAPLAAPPAFADAAALAGWLAEQRNDLEAPAAAWRRQSPRPSPLSPRSPAAASRGCRARARPASASSPIAASAEIAAGAIGRARPALVARRRARVG